MSLELSTIGIVVAALASFFFGFMVHGPVFGATWMSLMKITPQQMEEGKKKMQGKMQYYMLAALVQQLVTAAVMSHILANLGVYSIPGAIMAAVVLWFGFIVTTLLNGVLWEDRSKELYGFNIAYHLGSFVIIAVIVTVLS